MNSFFSLLFWLFSFSIKNIPFLGVCPILFCRLGVASFVKWQAITVGKKYGGLFLLPLDVAVGQLLDFRRESGEGIVSQVKHFEMNQLSDFGGKSSQVVRVPHLSGWSPLTCGILLIRKLLCLIHPEDSIGSIMSQKLSFCYFPSSLG